MGDKLIMSKKERTCKTILECVKRGELTQIEASNRLGLSYRQVKRRYKRFIAEGDAGLVHRSRGKPGTRCLGKEHREKALALYKTHYADFGPTLAAEKMTEDQAFPVKAETLRLWLKAAGIWHRRRQRKQYRSRRARRARFGELVQLDGSIHAWFTGNGEKQCLMNMVDDATGTTEAFLDTGETTFAALTLLERWIKKYGIPAAIYVDLKSVYVSPKSLHPEDEWVESDWLTHFSYACRRLGIKIIKAYSPQAKGRVERNHAVYQDRFVKELKLKGATTIEQANDILNNGFIANLNQKFAKPAADAQDGHLKLSPDINLQTILCWDITRTIRNDWTAQLDNQHYQLEKKQPVNVQPGQKITFKRHLKGEISLWYRDHRLAFHLIAARPIKAEKPKLPGYSTGQRSLNAKKSKHKSPWYTPLPTV